jgi:pimeloyl-ACP methyl ester carboxylesterase
MVPSGIERFRSNRATEALWLAAERRSVGRQSREEAQLSQIDDGVLQLSDGRALGYAQYGQLSSWPVFLFQGTPTSRLPHNPLETSVPVRLVVPERPGFGRSDFLHGRRLLDWARDVEELANHLGCEHFSVVGVSGGAPHALACGVRLADRIRRLGVVSGMGPIEAAGATAGMAAQRRLGTVIARHFPFLLGPLFWAVRNPARNPERFVRQFSEGFSASDRSLLADPALSYLRARSYIEATRQGVRGFAYEVALLTRPWGFSLAEVMSDVLLWHGEADASTPISMARYVAASLPRCRATYFPSEGHFVAARHWEEIVSSLLQ